MNGHAYEKRAGDPRRIVLTGGPGAGKTAILELVRRTFCTHVEVLPEAASVVFRGGFPRRPAVEERRAAQRAIFHVERELERVAEARDELSLVLCDRGTLDGLAYWPGDPDELFRAADTTFEAELSRYAGVIHLRTPTRKNGYHRDPIRVESAHEAELIDERLLEIWASHPNRHVIDSTPDFLTKARRAIAVLGAELPPLCAATLGLGVSSGSDRA